MAVPTGDRLALFSAAVPTWSAERMVAEAVAAGLHGVEWALGPGQVLSGDATPADAADAAELRERCAAGGLRVANLAVQDPQAMRAPSELARAAGLAVALGSPSVRLFTPAPDGDLVGCAGASATACRYAPTTGSACSSRSPRGRPRPRPNSSAGSWSSTSRRRWGRCGTPATR